VPDIGSVLSLDARKNKLLDLFLVVSTQHPRAKVNFNFGIDIETRPMSDSWFC